MALAQSLCRRDRVIDPERLDGEPLAGEAAEDRAAVEAIQELLLEIEQLLGVGDRAHHEAHRRQVARGEVLVVAGDVTADGEEAALAEERVGVEREPHAARTQPRRNLLRCHDRGAPGSIMASTWVSPSM